MTRAASVVSQRDLTWRRIPFFPEQVRGIVVTASAVEEHERHKTTAYQKRRKRFESKGNPAMFTHGNVVSGGPNGGRPDDS